MLNWISNPQPLRLVSIFTRFSQISRFASKLHNANICSIISLCRNKWIIFPLDALHSCRWEKANFCRWKNFTICIYIVDGCIMRNCAVYSSCLMEWQVQLHHSLCKRDHNWILKNGAAFVPPLGLVCASNFESQKGFLRWWINKSNWILRLAFPNLSAVTLDMKITFRLVTSQRLRVHRSSKPIFDSFGA